MPLTVPRLSSGSQVIWQLVCSLQAVVTGYFQRSSWCVFLVVGVVVVDFIAEDKCVPAHLVSPNFSSSSLDSQQPQPSTVKEHHDHFFLLLFSFPSLNKWLCVPHQLHSEWCWTVGLCSGMVLSLLKSLQCQFQNVILVLLKIPGHESQIVLTRKSNTSQHWSSGLLVITEYSIFHFQFCPKWLFDQKQMWLSHDIATPLSFWYIETEVQCLHMRYCLIMYYKKSQNQTQNYPNKGSILPEFCSYLLYQETMICKEKPIQIRKWTDSSLCFIYQSNLSGGC